MDKEAEDPVAQVAALMQKYRVSCADACRIVGISKATFYRYRKAGKKIAVRRPAVSADLEESVGPLLQSIDKLRLALSQLVIKPAQKEGP